MSELETGPAAEELTLEFKVNYIFTAIKKAETELLPALNGLAQGPLGGMLGGLFR